MGAAAVMSYDKLLELVPQYTERKDAAFIAQIPSFIASAEFRLATEVKGLGLLRVVTSKMSANNPLVKKPRNWRQTKSFQLQQTLAPRPFLRPRKFEYCQLYNVEAAAGYPEFYSDANYTHFCVAPIPSGSWTYQLSFYEKPEPLSSTNQSNWTTENAPQLILYATLLEAQPFLKNSAMLSIWQGQYAELAAAIGKEEENSNHDATE